MKCSDRALQSDCGVWHAELPGGILIHAGPIENPNVWQNTATRYASYQEIDWTRPDDVEALEQLLKDFRTRHGEASDEIEGNEFGIYRTSESSSDDSRPKPTKIDEKELLDSFGGLSTCPKCLEQAFWMDDKIGSKTNEFKWPPASHSAEQVPINRGKDQCFCPAGWWPISSPDWGMSMGDIERIVMGGPERHPLVIASSARESYQYLKRVLNYQNIMSPVASGIGKDMT
ncbi:hypothetical protein GGR57DRAFT_483162 [Xylariaceae sp. FL1272]|nr:hypothetical protein GGR57DRAFT_483162 [Xylariaceae sp. FL1272]